MEPVVKPRDVKLANAALITAIVEQHPLIVVQVLFHFALDRQHLLPV